MLDAEAKPIVANARVQGAARAVTPLLRLPWNAKSDLLFVALCDRTFQFLRLLRQLVKLLKDVLHDLNG